MTNNFVQRDLVHLTSDKVSRAVREQHCSGSGCVACGRILTLPDMKRRGFQSGAELGLCGPCFGTIYRSTFNSVHGVDDDIASLLNVCYNEDGWDDY